MTLRADEPAYWGKAEVGTNEKGKSRRENTLEHHTELPRMNHETSQPTIRTVCTAFKDKGMPSAHMEPKPLISF